MMMIRLLPLVAALLAAMTMQVDALIPPWIRFCKDKSDCHENEACVGPAVPDELPKETVQELSETTTAARGGFPLRICVCNHEICNEKKPSIKLCGVDPHNDDKVECGPDKCLGKCPKNEHCVDSGECECEDGKGTCTDHLTCQYDKLGNEKCLCGESGEMCMGDYVCNGTKCVDPCTKAGHPCGADEKCVPGKPPMCKPLDPCKPDPCKDGEWCFVKGHDYVCACGDDPADGRCKDDEKCVAVGGKKTCKPLDPCKGEKCPFDEICVEKDHQPKCVCALPPGDPKLDEPCDEGYKCVEGICKKSNPCSGKRCPYDEVCFVKDHEAKCVCGHDAHDDPCPEHYKCVNDECVPLDPCKGIKCPPGKTCVGGICKPKPGSCPGRKTCCRQKPCSSGYICKRGHCVPCGLIGKHCCKGRYCKTGRCRGGKCKGAPCGKKNKRCCPGRKCHKKNLKCRGGYCRKSVRGFF